MKQARWMLMVLAALLLSIGIASAELNYILPDSNSRELTWDEVARWDYETLGYAFNEIFARHGYVFHPGEKYDNYFSCQPWYTPNRDTNNQRAVYPYLNATEWANYELIKEVRATRLKTVTAANPCGRISPVDSIPSADLTMCSCARGRTSRCIPHPAAIRGAARTARLPSAQMAQFTALDGKTAGCW